MAKKTNNAINQAITAIFTANENLTAGQPVGISNGIGGIARGARTVTSTAHGNASITSTGINNNLYAEIGGEKFVYLSAQNQGSNLYVQVGTVDPLTNTFIVGTAVVVVSNFQGASASAPILAAICKLDTDKFAIFYVRNTDSTAVRAVVGTVSGTTISLGTAVTVDTFTGNVGHLNCCQIGTDKGAFVGHDAGTPTRSRAFAYTVSGTTFTFGAGVALSTSLDDDDPSYMVKIATDKFALVVCTSANAIFAQIGSISTVTITMGTVAQISSSTSINAADGYLQVVSPATDVFVVRFPATTANMSLVACTVSTTTITAGAVLASPSTLLGCGTGGIYSTDASTIFVTGTTWAKFTLSGTTLTASDLYANQMTTMSVGGAVYMANGYPVAFSLDATNLNMWIYGMSNNWIGTVQSTVNDGTAVVVVLTGPIDSNQSGLIPGTQYQSVLGVYTAVASNAAVTTLAGLNVVTALSSSQIVA